MSLINVNFGHLLTIVFDRLIAFDLFFFKDVYSEVGKRKLLGGKLDDYRIPVLMINSSLIVTIIYMVNF